MKTILFLIALGAQSSDWTTVTCSNSYTSPPHTRTAGLCSLPENTPPDEELVVTVESGDFRVIGGITQITPPLMSGGRVVRGRQVQIALLNTSPLRVVSGWKITIKWLDRVNSDSFEG